MGVAPQILIQCLVRQSHLWVRGLHHRSILEGQVELSGFNYGAISLLEMQRGPDDVPELVLPAVVEMPAQIAARTGTGIAWALIVI